MSYGYKNKILYYQELVLDLNKRLARYEPRKVYMTWNYSIHYLIVLKKAKNIKKRILKVKPFYSTDHIDSYGWQVIDIIECVSLFTYDYVYKKTD